MLVTTWTTNDLWLDSEFREVIILSPAAAARMEA